MSGGVSGWSSYLCQSLFYNSAGGDGVTDLYHHQPPDNKSTTLQHHTHIRQQPHRHCQPQLHRLQRHYVTKQPRTWVRWWLWWWSLRLFSSYISKDIKRKFNWSRLCCVLDEKFSEKRCIGQWNIQINGYLYLGNDIKKRIFLIGKFWFTDGNFYNVFSYTVYMGILQYACTLLFNRFGSVRFSFKEMNTFIQQGRTELWQKWSWRLLHCLKKKNSNKCCSFECSIQWTAQ